DLLEPIPARPALSVGAIVPAFLVALLTHCHIGTTLPTGTKGAQPQQIHFNGFATLGTPILQDAAMHRAARNPGQAPGSAPMLAAISQTGDTNSASGRYRPAAPVNTVQAPLVAPTVSITRRCIAERRAYGHEGNGLN